MEMPTIVHFDMPADDPERIVLRKLTPKPRTITQMLYRNLRELIDSDLILKIPLFRRMGK